MSSEDSEEVGRDRQMYGTMVISNIEILTVSMYLGPGSFFCLHQTRQGSGSKSFLSSSLKLTVTNFGPNALLRQIEHVADAQ